MVPYLSGPLPMPLQGPKHILIKRQAMTTGLENARVLANSFPGAESGDGGKRGIDGENRPLYIGNENTLIGMPEHRAGFGQAGIGFFSCRNISNVTVPQNATVVLFFRLGETLNPDRRFAVRNRA